MDFKTAALAAFDNEAVNASIQSFQRHIQGRYNVENFYPSFLKDTGAKIGTS